jgi:hypothetical protein
MSVIRVNGVYVVIISIDTRRIIERGTDRLKTMFAATARINND